MKRIANRKRYIGALKECLSARNDFGSLDYVADIISENEYLILTDIIGQVLMLNITGYNDAMIFHAIAEIECGKAPSNIISDKAEMMRIAKLR